MLESYPSVREGNYHNQSQIWSFRGPQKQKQKHNENDDTSSS